jgi:hypothetical protein
LPHLDRFLQVFSSSFLDKVTFDGGIFGSSAITSHHISIFSQMASLRVLDLQYCFSNVHPISFSSLANIKDNWTSLEDLYIKYAFGDPEWEREQLDQLVQHLRSTMEISLNSWLGSLSIWINTKETGDQERGLYMSIIEGGDESDT